MTIFRDWHWPLFLCLVWVILYAHRVSTDTQPARGQPVEQAVGARPAAEVTP